MAAGVMSSLSTEHALPRRRPACTAVGYSAPATQPATTIHNTHGRPHNLALPTDALLLASLRHIQAAHKYSEHKQLKYKTLIKKDSSYSITERWVLEPGSQPAGDVSHKPGGRLPILSARPAVTPATLKRAATNFAAWLTEARWV